ncbi:MAG TPA: hypothetical protein VGU45_11005 [Microvirga sp.]|jgi:hypothetical protein|nr:hypothetical protein [Microvirga sp.]
MKTEGALAHPMPLRKGLPLAFLTLLAGLSPARAESPEARAWLASQGYGVPSRHQSVICHGYGCNRRSTLAVDAWLTRAASLLQGAIQSPEAERKALAEAVRLYTGAIASHLGGRPDVPGSPTELSGTHGQMDCLDATANTTSLLVVLEERGHLRHHVVTAPQSRGFFFDGRYPHFTAVLAERRGKRWAVDPWKRAPGQRPDILPLDVWQQAS